MTEYIAAGAIASVPALDSHGALAETKPRVFVQGRPMLEANVLSCLAKGRRGQRQATLRLPTVDAVSRLEGQEVVVAHPLPLRDGTTRWHVWMVGITERFRDQRGSRQDGIDVQLTDALSVAMQQGLPRVWQESAGGALQSIPRPWPAQAGRLDPRGRSVQRFAIHHQEVYIPREGGGEAWTVGQALASVMAMLQVEAELRLTPDASGTLIEQTIDFGAGLGRDLEWLLERHRLQLRQRWIWSDGHAHPRLVVVQDEHARRTRAAARPTQSQGRAWASRWVHEQREPAPRKLTLLGEAPEVEARVELQPGWDASLQGEPITQYDPNTSTDFARYRNVYRRWVLNEDGSAEGPRYPLESLFGSDQEVRHAAPMRSLLTRDDAGRRLPLEMQYSLDAGLTWLAWRGFNRLTDRAGVYVDEEALPANWISAAQAGQLRVQVTGTLVSPAVMQRTRWIGNALSGGVVREEVLTGPYSYRRVDPSSPYWDEVQAGQRDADQVDERRAMETALVQAASAFQPFENKEDRATIEVTLPGAGHSVEPGDRWLGVDPSWADPDGAVPLEPTTWRVREVSRELKTQETRLVLEPGIEVKP